MVSPTAKETRMYFWDYLRKKLDINIEKIKSKDELIKVVRNKFGLEKYEKAKGKMKSVLAFIRKTDFWKKRKEDLKLFKQKSASGKVYWRTYQKWSKEEEEILRKNLDKSNKEIRKILMENGYYRSLESIAAKKYRLKKQLEI